MRFFSALRRAICLRGTATAFLTGCLLALTVGHALAAEEMRDWLDSSGRHRIRGKLQAFEFGKVTLEQANGKVMEIEISKLSTRDQQYVVQHAMGLKKAAEDSPFKEKTEKPEAAPAAEDADQVKSVSPDWSAAAQVPVMPEQAGWKFKTPIAGPEAAERPAGAIVLPPRENFFEGCSAVVANYSGQRVLVGLLWDFSRPQPQTRLVLCDLVRHRSLVAAATAKAIPLALGDNGGQVLMSVEKDNKKHLELWGLAPRGITRLWRMASADNDADVKWAAFLDGGRFAVLLGSGKLGVLKTAAAEPVFCLSLAANSTPALSPDRKYLAFAESNRIGVLDLAAGKVLAVENTPKLAFPRLCFSPDGSRLACVDFGKVRVWNFADGATSAEFSLAALQVHVTDVVWPQERYLLFNMQKLIDLEAQVAVWSYEGAEKAAWADGVGAFVVSEHGNKPVSALVTARVPPAGLTAQIAKAMESPDFYVLKAGMTVTLNLSGVADAEEREKASAALTRKLEANGMKVGPGGSIELVAATEAGKEQKISYRGFGVSPWQQYTVREYLTTLKFVHQGQTAWQTGSSSIPHMIQLKEGETIDQVLRRSEKPTYGLFEKVELPKLLAKPSESRGLGMTRLTVNGAE
jgi:hypothetical protein